MTRPVVLIGKIYVVAVVEVLVVIIVAEDFSKDDNEVVLLDFMLATTINALEEASAKH